MSEFAPTPKPHSESETADEKESQGLILADEINQLRAFAKTKEDYDVLMRKIKSLTLIFEPHMETGIDQAIELLGPDNVLGPEEVKLAFGIDLTGETLPVIPFSREELEKAGKIGQMLVLRVSWAPDGSPLTMQRMEKILADQFERDEKGKVLYDTSWYQEEEFFIKETPEFSWALVGKEVIPNSTDKNYFEQTTLLAEYITFTVFNGEPLPAHWQGAIDEFIDKSEVLKDLMSSDSEEAARCLSELSLNQMTRQSPAEALYDLMIRFQNNKERLLEDHYTWTKRLSSGGSLVNVGGFDADGADVSDDGPGYSGGSLGVSFSRSR